MAAMNPYQRYLVGEIKLALKFMESADEPSEKLYYFSAVPAAINRVFNMNYDADLVYAHFILNHTYLALAERLKRIEQGDNLVPLTSEHFVKLENLTRQLAERLDKGAEIGSLLKTFVLLSYSTTGNGHYLMKKEYIKL